LQNATFYSDEEEVTATEDSSSPTDSDPFHVFDDIGEGEETGSPLYDVPAVHVCLVGRGMFQG